MSPLTVGVVVPARDASRTIARALGSVLAQAAPPDRVLVVDDGSRDDTAAVARRIGGVEVVSQAAAGPGSARNVGVAHLGTDIVAFLDADDAWEPDFMGPMADALAEGADVAVAGCLRRNEAGDIVDRWVLDADALTLDALIRGNRITTSGVALRRAAFERVGGFDATLEFNQDFDLWVRLHLAGARFVPTDAEVTYAVRDEPEPLEKLQRVEAAKDALHDKLHRLLPQAQAREAEARGHLDLARRYLKSGYPSEARRQATRAGLRPDALAVLALATLPRPIARGARAAVRGVRRARRTRQ